MVKSVKEVLNTKDETIFIVSLFSWDYRFIWDAENFIFGAISNLKQFAFSFPAYIIGDVF